jgi:hypothetical protein
MREQAIVIGSFAVNRCRVAGAPDALCYAGLQQPAAPNSGKNGARPGALSKFQANKHMVNGRQFLLPFSI